MFYLTEKKKKTLAETAEKVKGAKIYQVYNDLMLNHFELFPQTVEFFGIDVSKIPLDSSYRYTIENGFLIVRFIEN